MSSKPGENICPMTVMFTAKDMKRSVAFYRDVLGFSLRESWPDPNDPWWCSLVLENQVIMLGAAMTPGEGEHDCSSHDSAPDDGGQQWMVDAMAAFKATKAPGAGAFLYVQVEDVDAYHAKVTSRGAEPRYAPKSQFYGIRDFAMDDPDGYHLLFYKNITLESCQSCGMPLTEAQPGQMYCDYCTDDEGKLRTYEQVFEGTVTGYFMHMQKMKRPEAEQAAKEHLGKMPAWAGRG